MLPAKFSAQNFPSIPFNSPHGGEEGTKFKGQPDCKAQLCNHSPVPPVVAVMIGRWLLPMT